MLCDFFSPVAAFSARLEAIKTRRLKKQLAAKLHADFSIWDRKYLIQVASDKEKWKDFFGKNKSKSVKVLSSTLPLSPVSQSIDAEKS